jgi:neutral ceramidase
MARRIGKPMNRRKFLKHGISAGGLWLSSSTLKTLAGSAPPNSFLLAGTGKRVVTPPVFIPYLTGSAAGTNAPFTGIHDELHARALVLDDGRTSLALLAVDAIGYDNSILGKHRHFTQELRKRIAARTGLPREAIMLTATHAHSTPETIGLTRFGETAGAAAWLENHLTELVATVVEAWNHRLPVRVRAGKTKVDGIARYRRILLKNGKLSVHGPLPKPSEVALPWQLDEDLNLIHFERLDGSTHAVLMNYTAHPVTAMLLPQVCADFPGVAAARVEQEFKGATCLFTNGAAGNVNSARVSTNYEDVEALGRKLGEAAVIKVRGLGNEMLLKDTRLSVRSTQFPLHPRSCPPEKEAEKIAKADPSAKNLTMLRLARKLAEDPLRAEIQAMQLGPIKWVSLPGEAFVETGLALKQAGATFVAGYANGWLGYFPLPRCYAEGGYEVGLGAWSRVAPESAALLEAKARQLLNRLARV